MTGAEQQKALEAAGWCSSQGWSGAAVGRSTGLCPVGCPHSLAKEHEKYGTILKKKEGKRGTKHKTVCKDRNTEVFVISPSGLALKSHTFYITDWKVLLSAKPWLEADHPAAGLRARLVQAPTLQCAHSAH